MIYDLTPLQTTLLLALVVWEMVWKGFALWRAAHRDQSYWFVALLVVNSVGILPIIYLLTNSNKKSSNELH
jgi:hypothetical protein